MTERILEPAQLERYADAITRSIALKRGDTIVVRGSPAARELMLACAASAYRRGAHAVDVVVFDPLLMRARLEYGKDGAVGAVTPWHKTRLRELMKPDAAEIFIHAESDPGFLDGIPQKRITTEYARVAAQTRTYRRASLDGRVRWTIADWPSDHWAKQVYPKLSATAGKQKLAQDLLWFCRLTDDDGPGSSGWIEHCRAVARRSQKLTRLALARVELRGPGTELEARLVPGTRWLGSLEKTEAGATIATNIPSEETFTSPDANGTEGTFTCTFPLSFQGASSKGSAASSATGGSCGSTRNAMPIVTSSRATSTATRRTDGVSASSRSWTRRRASARPAGSTTTRCWTRTPPRTSRSAPASARRAPRSPHAGSTSRRCTST